MKFTAALFSLVAAVASVTALPSGADPDFTVSQADLDGALTCPGRASYMGVKNPLLLVPGTGTTGAESWDNSFAKVAPSLGFEPCYISPAPYLLNDTTLSAQYFVNAVRRLTAESGKAVPVMGWSQGNLIIQTALTFYPQVRSKVDRFISFAGDFRGTTRVGLLLSLTSNKQVPPSVWQQAKGSQLLTALANAGGLNAIVPTTSIYSTSDEIVQPEDSTPSASSYLNGATNVLAQTYCKGISIFHGGQLYSNFTFSVAKNALQSSDKVWDPSAFNKGYCGGYVADGLQPSDKDAVQSAVLADLGRLTSAQYSVPCEPVLPAYAKKYASANPPCHAAV